MTDTEKKIENDIRNAAIMFRGFTNLPFPDQELSAAIHETVFLTLAIRREIELQTKKETADNEDQTNRDPQL